MRRNGAERLVLHLRDAVDALNRARREASGFAKEERQQFGGLIREFIEDLEADLLSPIYDQHTDLRPEQEEQETPTVCSDLRWDQVRLSPNTSVKDVDNILFSLLTPYWQKVALVLVKAYDSCNITGRSIDYEIFAARLQDLSDQNKIEGIGDLRMWRFSEVRLKDN
jgi:hypothetical protein